MKPRGRRKKPSKVRKSLGSLVVRTGPRYPGIARGSRSSGRVAKPG